MTTDLTGEFVLQSRWDHRFDAGVSEMRDPASDAPGLEFQQSWTYGTGAGQIDEMFRSRYTVAPGTVNIDIDLQSLTNAAGEAFGFATIREIVVRNRGTESTDQILIGAAAATPWLGPFGTTTSTQRVDGGGIWSAVNPNAGYAVTAGAKTLRIAHSAGSESTVDIVIKGIKS